MILNLGLELSLKLGVNLGLELSLKLGVKLGLKAGSTELKCPGGGNLR
jgi:hypothetical protein